MAVALKLAGGSAGTVKRTQSQYESTLLQNCDMKL